MSHCGRVDHGKAAKHDDPSVRRPADAKQQRVPGGVSGEVPNEDFLSGACEGFPYSRQCTGRHGQPIAVL